jgi:hypothetical protein
VLHLFLQKKHETLPFHFFHWQLFHVQFIFVQTESCFPDFLNYADFEITNVAPNLIPASLQTRASCSVVCGGA